MFAANEVDNFLCSMENKLECVLQHLLEQQNSSLASAVMLLKLDRKGRILLIIKNVSLKVTSEMFS